MFSFAVKHVADTNTGRILASRVLGASSGRIKPVRRHYDMRMSYTVNPNNGDAAADVSALFPSGKYASLSTEPTWAHHRFVGWYDTNIPIVLPSGYSLLDYVECTGTQWVDTLCTAKATTRIDASWTQVEITSQQQRLWGVKETNTNYFDLFWKASQWQGRFFASTSVPVIAAAAGVTYTVSADAQAGTITINDTTVNLGTTPDKETVGTIPIFGRRNDGTVSISYPAKMKLHWFQIRENGVLVRNLVPVKDANNVAALYDLASGKTLYSATETALVAGSVVSQDMGTKVNPSDAVVYGRAAVYGRWQLPATVTFDATTNGGTMPSGWSSPDYYVGQAYGTLPAPTKTGEVFLGWFTSGGTRVTTASTVAAGTLTARYAAVTYATKWEVNCTSTSYLKTGIYSATSRNSANPTVVDWGDGTYDVVYGNISQLVHTYASTGTRTVQVSDNISAFALSTSSTTFCKTTTSNYYNVRRILAVSPNVTTIPSYAFYYLYYLYSAVFGGNGESLTLNSYAFYYCMRSGTAGTIDLSGRKCTSIPSSFCYYCYYLKTFLWPSGVTSIGGSAFRYCWYYSTSSASIAIPEGVTSVGTYAFANCTYLTAVTLPTTLTTLGNQTFYYCTRLATIYANRSTAPTVSSATFGNSSTYYTGRNSYSAGTNRLYIPSGATGYDASYWADPLCSSTKCGFTREVAA